jgi:hypothetical protein
VKKIKILLALIFLLFTFASRFSHADDATEKLFQKAEFEHSSGLDNSAFKIYKKLAEQGHAISQYRLGYMYYKGESRYGEGPGKNAKLAIEWFQKAAIQGNQQAQTYLGNIYYYGKGVPVDHKLAILWYKKSSVQDNNLANSELYPADIIKQIDEEMHQSDLSELSEAKSKGFDTYTDLMLATKIVATPVELAKLKSLGVNTEQDYNNAVNRKKKLVYPGENISAVIIQFLGDEQEGKKFKLGPTVYRAKLNKQAADALAKTEEVKARIKAEADKAHSKAKEEKAKEEKAKEEKAKEEKAKEEKAKAKAIATIATLEPSEQVTLSVKPHVDVTTDFNTRILAFEKIHNSTAIDKQVGDDTKWYQMIISTQVIVCSQLTDTPKESLDSISRILGEIKTEDIKIGGTVVEILVTQSDGKQLSLYLGRARCMAMKKFTENKREMKLAK